MLSVVGHIVADFQYAMHIMHSLIKLHSDNNVAIEI